MFWELKLLVMCPDHTLSQGKGCGDFLGCAVHSEEANTMPCKLANEIGLHQKHAIIVQQLILLTRHNQECAQ